MPCLNLYMDRFHKLQVKVSLIRSINPFCCNVIRHFNLNEEADLVREAVEKSLKHVTTQILIKNLKMFPQQRGDFIEDYITNEMTLI